MYNILLVDDEAPALRLMQAIINKYASENYTIVASCTNGKDALECMAHQSIDLLMTDISMPEMDGISLALKARALCPSIHIVIISGYADFEYAKGGIQASVDDYILKPVSITSINSILDIVKEKLDVETAERKPKLLSALLAGQPYDSTLINRLYADNKYCFALVRWGNLVATASALSTTSVLANADIPCTVLSGRDENEQLIISNDGLSPTNFQVAVKSYVSRCRSTPTWTIVFGQMSNAITTLPVFFRQAMPLMEQSVVIGYHRYVFVSNMPRRVDVPHIAYATIKKLTYFIQENNTKMIKDILFSLAADWEKRQLPQLYVNNMILQLVNLSLDNNFSQRERQSDLMRDVREFMHCAASYGDLIASTYAILFDENIQKDKNYSAEDLYQQAIQFIREHYAEPIGISNVCSEVGISQTYLSRLLRKYGNTSFTSFLTQLRIESAMQLIKQHPAMLLRDVSNCVGYDDSSYFSKVFHQVTGQTPSKYISDLKESSDKNL